MSQNSDSSEKSERLLEMLRLGLVVGLIVIGTVSALYAVLNDQTKDLSAIIKELGKDVDLAGLSPATKACYLVHTRYSSIIIASCVGVALGLIYLFGDFLYRKFRDSSHSERKSFWEAVSTRIETLSPGQVPELMVSFQEYERLILDRRNLYWNLFIRACLALVVVMVIALLICVCKIESQAGLPIITGIISYVIGQSADVAQGRGSQTVVLQKHNPENPGPGKPSDSGAPSMQ